MFKLIIIIIIVWFYSQIGSELENVNYRTMCGWVAPEANGHFSTKLTRSPTTPRMSGSLSESPLNKSVGEIPIEIVSEEEMALIEAALSAARPSIPAIRSPFDFHRNARSIQSITVLSKRSFSGRTVLDIEDSGDFASTQKKGKEAEPLLHQFRRKKGLSVTDITGTVLNIFS